MTIEHRRLRTITISLFVALIITVVAIVALSLRLNSADKALVACYSAADVATWSLAQNAASGTKVENAFVGTAFDPATSMQYCDDLVHGTKP